LAQSFFELALQLDRNDTVTLTNFGRLCKSVAISTARESILAEPYSWILGTTELVLSLVTSTADPRIDIAAAFT